jgi:histidine triad (HIT) family protein
MDCIFCSIINKDEHEGMIFRDDKIVSFLDIRPLSFGHTLVVPVGHYTDFREMPTELMGDYFAQLQKIALAVERATEADGFNIICNTGIAASQSVFHLHYHIIPRYHHDEVFKRLNFKKYDHSITMQSYAEKIKKQLF